MRLTMRGAALASVLTIGGLLGSGTTAHAQGFGAYFGFSSGYPALGYGGGYGPVNGGGYGGYPVPFYGSGGYGGYPGYGGYGGYPGYGGYGGGFGYNRGYGYRVPYYHYNHHHHGWRR